MNGTIMGFRLARQLETSALGVRSASTVGAGGAAVVIVSELVDDGAAVVEKATHTEPVSATGQTTTTGRERLDFANVDSVN